MKTPPKLRTLRLSSLVMVASLSFQACLDDDTVGPSQATDAGAREFPDNLGEDSHMLALARAIPGFGGYWYESAGGPFVIALTDAGAGGFSTARQAVSASLLADVTHALPPTQRAAQAPRRFVEREVEYSFIELARHRARLRPYLPSIPGVASLEMDEESNRIGIGLTDLSATKAVEDLASALAVPLAMISFHRTGEVRASSVSSVEPYTSNGPTLRKTISVPDSSLRAGYQVTSKGGSTCTLGYTALRAPAAQQVFVSNSHCSKAEFSLDSGYWGQPAAPYTVAQEIRDPKARWCYWLTLPIRVFDIPIPFPAPFPIPIIPHKCRDSDSALMRIDTTIATIALGEIARTTKKSNCDNCAMPLDIDANNPTIKITSSRQYNVANESLDKIGRTTGWTYGVVEHTCIDWFSEGALVIDA